MRNELAGQADGPMRPSSDEPHPVLDRDRASRARTSIFLVLGVPLVIVAFLVGHRVGSDAPPATSPEVAATLPLALAMVDETWSTGATILRVHGCTVGATCGELLVRQGWDTACTYVLTYRSGDATGHTFSADGGRIFSCGGNDVRVTLVGDGLIKVKFADVASSEVILERFADD